MPGFFGFVFLLTIGSDLADPSTRMSLVQMQSDKLMTEQDQNLQNAYDVFQNFLVGSNNWATDSLTEWLDPSTRKSTRFEFHHTHNKIGHMLWEHGFALAFLQNVEHSKIFNLPEKSFTFPRWEGPGEAPAAVTEFLADLQNDVNILQNSDGVKALSGMLKNDSLVDFIHSSDHGKIGYQGPEKQATFLTNGLGLNENGRTSPQWNTKKVCGHASLSGYVQDLCCLLGRDVACVNTRHNYKDAPANGTMKGQTDFWPNDGKDRIINAPPTKVKEAAIKIKNALRKHNLPKKIEKTDKDLRIKIEEMLDEKYPQTFLSERSLYDTDVAFAEVENEILEIKNIEQIRQEILNSFNGMSCTFIKTLSAVNFSDAPAPDKIFGELDGEPFKQAVESKLQNMTPEQLKHLKMEIHLLKLLEKECLTEDEFTGFYIKYIDDFNLVLKEPDYQKAQMKYLQKTDMGAYLRQLRASKTM